MNNALLLFLADENDGGGGITPSGTIHITQNGTQNVSQYAEADVNVEPALTTLNVTANRTYRPEEILSMLGYDGWNEVIVNVSDVVQSGFFTRDSGGGQTVTVQGTLSHAVLVIDADADLSAATGKGYARLASVTIEGSKNGSVVYNSSGSSIATGSLSGNATFTENSIYFGSCMGGVKYLWFAW